jgi:hypothetical protein
VFGISNARQAQLFWSGGERTGAAWCAQGTVIVRAPTRHTFAQASEPEQAISPFYVLRSGRNGLKKRQAMSFRIAVVSARLFGNGIHFDRTPR